MKNCKSFFAGMLTMLLIVCLAGTALATTGKVTKELEYRNIQVTLDGKKLDLKDARGNPVEPFMFDGTNYLPVRALAESLGLEVAWDGSTNTVVLTTPSDDASSGEAVAENTFLFSKDHIRFYYTGYEAQSDGGYEFNIRIENDSDYTLHIYEQDFAINSLAVDCNFGLDIMPGETVEQPITVTKEALDKAKIDEVRRFSLMFCGYEKNSLNQVGYNFNTGVAKVTIK